MSEELTRQDKSRLLGVVDGKNIRNDYDEKFYKKMKEIAPLAVDEVDDRVRRAILRYVSEGKGAASQEENGGFVMMGFLHGYMVGRKLKRDITKKPDWLN